MKIIHITHGYPPQPGGVQKVTQELTTRLAKNGHTVEVFAPWQRTASFNDGRLSVNFLPSISLTHTPIIFGLLGKLLRFPENSVLHVHVAKAFLPEITYLVSRLKHIPYVAHFHLDVDPTGIFGFLLPLYKKYILKRVLQSASRVIVLSEAHKSVVLSKYSLKKERVVVIPNGVSGEFYLKDKEQSDEIKNLLYVGRLQAQKNVAVLIEMMKHLPASMSLHIVGDGELRSSIEELIVLSGLSNIHMYGSLYGDDLLKKYEEADVFILASEREGLPLVLVEAMAAGVPIVASDVSGIHEFVTDAGVLVSPPTAENFAKAVMSLAENKQLRNELLQKGRLKALHHNWDEIVSQLESVYKEVHDENN